MRHSLGYIIGYVGASTIALTMFIGTIYFLIKGLEIPFRKAISNPWIIIVSLGLSLLGFMNDSKSPSGEKISYIYSQKESREFMLDCADRIKSESKMNDLSAEKICSCELNEIQKIYTFDDLKKMTNNMGENKLASHSLQDISRRCIQKR